MNALRTLFVILCVSAFCARIFEPACASPAETTLLTRPDPAAPGGTVEVIGAGFCMSPCSPVTLRIDNVVVASHVRVDASGQFSTTFAAPFVSGNYTLIARQTDGGATLGAQSALTVSATGAILSGPAPNQSPRTTTPLMRRPSGSGA